MNNLRNYFRDKLGPYLGPDPASKAQKYLYLSKVVYCFSAGTALLLLLHINSKRIEFEEKEKELKKKALNQINEPLPDESENKLKPNPPGIFEFHDGLNIKRINFDKDRYMETIEKEDTDKENFREAKRKLLDTSESSTGGKKESTNLSEGNPIIIKEEIEAVKD